MSSPSEPLTLQQLKDMKELARQMGATSMGDAKVSGSNNLSVHAATASAAEPYSALAGALAGKADKDAMDAALALKADKTALDAAVNAEASARNDAINNAVSNLLDGAPEALNTLNELAAALGDDSNYASTVTNAIADKADKTVVETALAGKVNTADVASGQTLACDISGNAATAGTAVTFGTQHVPEWTPGGYYEKGDIVKHNGKFFNLPENLNLGKKLKDGVYQNVFVTPWGARHFHVMNNGTQIYQGDILAGEGETFTRNDGATGVKVKLSWIEFAPWTYNESTGNYEEIHEECGLVVWTVLENNVLIMNNDGFVEKGWTPWSHNFSNDDFQQRGRKVLNDGVYESVFVSGAPPYSTRHFHVMNNGTKIYQGDTIAQEGETFTRDDGATGVKVSFESGFEVAPYTYNEISGDYEEYHPTISPQYGLVYWTFLENNVVTVHNDRFVELGWTNWSHNFSNDNLQQIDDVIIERWSEVTTIESALAGKVNTADVASGQTLACDISGNAATASAAKTGSALEGALNGKLSNANGAVSPAKLEKDEAGKVAIDISGNADTATTATNYAQTADAWAAKTLYAAGAVVSHGGSFYKATHEFTSGDEFVQNLGKKLKDGVYQNVFVTQWGVRHFHVMNNGTQVYQGDILAGEGETFTRNDGATGVKVKLSWIEFAPWTYNESTGNYEEIHEQYGLVVWTVLENNVLIMNNDGFVEQGWTNWSHNFSNDDFQQIDDVIFGGERWSEVTTIESALAGKVNTADVASGQTLACDISGNAATATTALSCSGNAATATTATQYVTADAWAEYTNYDAGTVVKYEGAFYKAKDALYSQNTFVSDNWDVVTTIESALDLKLDASAVAANKTLECNISGNAATATTATNYAQTADDWATYKLYAAGDVVKYEGAFYKANNAFLSGGTFVLANWDDVPTTIEDALNDKLSNTDRVINQQHIAYKAIRSDHINDSAIHTRHIQNSAVTPSRLEKDEAGKVAINISGNANTADTATTATYYAQTEDAWAQGAYYLAGAVVKYEGAFYKAKNTFYSQNGFVSDNWDDVTTTIKSALDLKADQSEMDTALADKADKSTMNTALDLKAPLASPVFTGTPEAPTAAATNNTDQIATTAFVKTAIDNLVGEGVSDSLDTLKEIGDYLKNETVANGIVQQLAGKVNTADVASGQTLACNISGNADTATNYAQTADPWATGALYAAGDVVKYEGAFYKANVEITNDNDFDLTKWDDVTTIESALALKADQSAMNTALAAKLDSPGTVPFPGINQIGATIVGVNQDDHLGHAVSMNADGTIVAVGAYFGEETNGSGNQNTGRVTVYERNETTGDWEQMGNDIYGPNASDQAGWSVSLSDDGLTLAVGINEYDNTTPYLGQAGMVRVYQYDADGNGGNGQWDQMGSDLVGNGENQFFGHAVSLSGDGNVVAVGATNGEENGYPGRAKVYSWNPPVEGQNGSWTQEGDTFVLTYNGSIRASTGYSVSLNHDGTVIAIGAPTTDSNGYDAGITRVYQRNTEDNYTPVGWTELGDGFNYSRGESSYDNSGTSVSLSDNPNGVMRLAIGAPYNDRYPYADGGHVRVFEYVSDNNSWTQLGSDIDGDESSMYSGTSVSLSLDGNTVAIGAPGAMNAQNNSTGHARIYTWDGAAWTQVGSDLEGNFSGDYFGKAVSLSADGTTVAIGGWNMDNGRGNVRVYSLYKQVLDITATTALSCSGNAATATLATGATGDLLTTINGKLDASAVAAGKTLACNITGIVNNTTDLHFMGALKINSFMANHNLGEDGEYLTSVAGAAYGGYLEGPTLGAGYTYRYWSNHPYSLIASMYIAASGYYAKSDRRIKTDIEDVPDALALDQVRRIPCRYYKYTDKLRKGPNKVIGFIAQEVNEVLPSAVSKTTEEIPDHMKLAELTWEDFDGKHFMTVSNLNEDVVDGTKVKFMCYTGTPPEFNEDGSVKTPASDDFKEEEECVIMENGKFEMKKKYDSVFIYGKEVNDFLHIDKQKIFALHHSAIQELDKTVEAQKATIAAQQAAIDALMARVAALEGQ